MKKKNSASAILPSFSEMFYEVIKGLHEINDSLKKICDAQQKQSGFVRALKKGGNKR